MISSSKALACALGAVVSCAPLSLAAPYVPVVLPPMANPAVGPGVIPVDEVFGKEYSRDIDQDAMGAALPEQVVAWDGVGGTLDGLNYTGSRPVGVPRLQQVDALANSLDAMYDETLSDRAHLIFSHTDRVGIYNASGVFGGFGPVVPMSGPVLLTNGNTILGAAEVSVEEAGAYAGPSVQHGWATASMVNSMAPAADLDALEVWGPEPALAADSNKYSLDGDFIGGAGTSVWSYDLGTGVSVPYISHGAIVTAVTTLLGAVPTTAFGRDQLPSFEAINVDALMVQDRDGVDLQFGGPGDSIIFSIRQIVDPADSDGYYATGSELFVLEASAAGIAPSFLFHGGHLWDHDYALNNLGVAGLLPDQRAFIDINALEAVGELVASGVPEPGTVAMLGLATIAGGYLLRRRAAS